LSHKDRFHELSCSHKSPLRKTCQAIQYLCQSVDKQTVGTLVAEEGSERSVTGREWVSAVSRKDTCNQSVTHTSVMVGRVGKHTFELWRCESIVERMVFGGMTSH